MIKLKRAYETVSPTDGTRLLVERLWPRGLSQEKLKLDGYAGMVYFHLLLDGLSKAGVLELPLD